MVLAIVSKKHESVPSASPLVLEIDIGELLPVVIADDKGRANIFTANDALGMAMV